MFNSEKSIRFDSHKKRYTTNDPDQSPNKLDSN